MTGTSKIHLVLPVLLCASVTMTCTNRQFDGFKTIDGANADTAVIDAAPPDVAIVDAAPPDTAPPDAAADAAISKGWITSAGPIEVPGQADEKTLALGPADNIHVVGHFMGDVVFGTTTLTASSSKRDIFVTRLDKSGSFDWAVSAGGSGSEVGNGIAVDGAGNSYITGGFRETATFGTFSLVSKDGTDIYLAKLDGNGKFLWVTQAGGKHGDYGRRVAVDSKGNIYLTGLFYETATFGTTTLTSKGGQDGFVARLDKAGKFLWVKAIPGYQDDQVYGVALNSAGDIHIAGFFSGTVTLGKTTLTCAGKYDAFVAKLNPAGTFLWAASAGGAKYEHCEDVAVDATNNVYIAGAFQESITVGTTVLKTTAKGGNNFVARLSSTGKFLWAVAVAEGNILGGKQNINVDSTGTSYLTVPFQGSATLGGTTITSAGNSDILVARLSSSGKFLGLKTAGGTGRDGPGGAALDSAQNLYVARHFQGTPTFGTTTLTAKGAGDHLFVWKIPAGSF